MQINNTNVLVYDHSKVSVSKRSQHSVIFIVDWQLGPADTMPTQNWQIDIQSKALKNKGRSVPIHPLTQPIVMIHQPEFSNRSLNRNDDLKHSGFLPF